VSAARTTTALRNSASIALGAMVVHQLRYLVGYGDGAGAALGAQGHAYLATILPALIVLAVSSLVGTVVAGALSAPGTTRRRAGWAFCTVTLLVLFGIQETVEGALATGHPDGLGAAFGHGGWIAVPISIAVGGLVSLLLSALGLVERTLAGVVRTPEMPRAAGALGRPRAPMAPLLARAPLAFGLARRPPPHISA